MGAAPDSAMEDSGATRPLLKPKAARLFAPKKFNPQKHPMEVIYGGGNRSSVLLKVQVDESEALVVPDLQDTLVSFLILPIKDLQFCSILLVESAGRVISNPLNDKRIVLKKDIGTWRLSHRLFQSMITGKILVLSTLFLPLKRMLMSPACSGNHPCS